ncbi:UNVERIFIED_CONTAM: hypothetical protein Sindi_3088400 [Sesamum indicum]
MQWMERGDQCSQVFFRKISQRRSARRILQINDDYGVTHSEPKEARYVLTEKEASSLLLPVTLADVKQAVFDITEDKTPGPDGYSSSFFKAAWPIVGQEVTKAVMNFFNAGRLLKQINTSLLALITKVHAPMTVSDFRLISCCNVLDKIIAKIIVQRLGVILDKLISPGQAAFVPVRSIGDNIMLARELFTGYNQSHFMIAVMELFGFPSTFVKWIEGDPVSPYLFVLVMEVLQLGLLQLIDQHELFSFNWKCDTARVFQLGFADDVLLFCHADMDSIGVFKTGSNCLLNGRVQIIKSVLMALSLYWVSTFILLKKVINEIEKRLRTFLWKGTTTSGYPKVAWKDLCRPKDEGGLRFKDICSLNRALMTKTLFDVIRCDRTSIWVEWLYQGRLRDTSIWTIGERGGSCGWLKILRLQNFLRTMVDYQIGDGRIFYLWQDPWHHLSPLNTTFP